MDHGSKLDDLLYDHFSEKDDLWFDFMADTDDGGNSFYSVARLLAQPSLPIHIDSSVLNLPRVNLLIIGGDLAYEKRYNEDAKRRSAEEVKDDMKSLKVRTSKSETGETVQKTKSIS